MASLAEVPKQELVTIAPSPIQMLAEAIASGQASVEQTAQLYALQLQWEANEAKKAYQAAFTAFKAETIRIVRDKENKQYSKPGSPAMYTSLENMVATVTPFLSKHGLSHHWEINQEGQISVSCVLTHTLGHSTSVTMSGPPDDSGAKNKLQQIKSTTTYLKVATFESVCGLASAYGSLNDDGNSAAPKPQGMPEQELLAALDAIANAAHVTELHTIFTAHYKAARAVGDQDAMNQILSAKDKRKEELA